jgi:hypothetical protein
MSTLDALVIAMSNTQSIFELAVWIASWDCNDAVVELPARSSSSPWLALA